MVLSKVLRVQDPVEASVKSLLEAYRTHHPIAPLITTYPSLTIDDAYQIQLAQVQAWVSDGRRILGRKVGLTSPAMQAQMNVSQPDFGHLMDDMFFAENVPVPADRFLQPRAEPEVAFVLGRDLVGPGVTVAEAALAVDYVMASLEIIDSRIADWKIGIVDTIADNASSGVWCSAARCAASTISICVWVAAFCIATVRSSAPAPVARFWDRRCTPLPGWPTRSVRSGRVSRPVR